MGHFQDERDPEEERYWREFRPEERQPYEPPTIEPLVQPTEWCLHHERCSGNHDTPGSDFFCDHDEHCDLEHW